MTTLTIEKLRGAIDALPTRPNLRVIVDAPFVARDNLLRHGDTFFIGRALLDVLKKQAHRRDTSTAVRALSSPLDPFGVRVEVFGDSPDHVALAVDAGFMANG